MDVIALDLGRSAVKIAAPNIPPFIQPTAVCLAVDTERLAVGATAEDAKRDLVEVDGVQYFIGTTAQKQSRDKKSEGLRDDWIESPEHKAILKGAYLAAKRESGADDGILMLGLPSRLFAEQRDRLREIAALTLHLPKENIHVVPQAYGAYMALMLDEQAAVAKGRDPNGETWGTIDVGYFTTDFGLLEGGDWLAFAAESVGGTHTAAEALMSITKGLQMKLPEAEESLRRKSIKNMGKVTDLSKEVGQVADHLAGDIVAAAKQAFGDRLPRLDGILIAGGGAELVASQIKAVFPHATTVPNSRYAIAQGMQRFGMLKTGATSRK